MENKESNFSPQSLSELPVGFEFQPTILQLSELHISKYLEAIDDSIDFVSLGLVPPLILAACANTALTKSFTAPPGTIHVSQDFEFLKTVAVGDAVSCRGVIAQKLERGRLSLIVLEINILNQNGDKVLSGKATITVPK
ncbi:hypothetical protein ACFLTJ_04100, partial [Chloroflexota bacterium]